MYRLKLGRSINFGEFFEKNISEAEENGFDTLDFDLTTFWHERDKEIELYKRIEQGLKRIEKSNLALNGVHISFGPNWDFSELNEEKRPCRVETDERNFRTRRYGEAVLLYRTRKF